MRNITGNDTTDDDTPDQGGASGPSAAQPNAVALMPAPRPVPALLRVYLHALYSLPGVFVLGFGLCMFTAFGLNSDWKAAAFLLPTASARGIVTGQYETNGSIGGGRNGGRGNTEITAVTYTFPGPGGVPCHGVSYGTSEDIYWVDTTGTPDPNSLDDAPVSVQYVKGYPALSRIRRLRTGVFGAYTLATFIFPLTGFFFLRGCLRLARRTCLVLSEGRQDPSTGNLYPPPGQERPKDPVGGFELIDFMTGPPHIEDGQLYPPAMGRVLLVFGLLAVILLGDVALLQRGVSQLGY